MAEDEVVCEIETDKVGVSGPKLFLVLWQVPCMACLLLRAPRACRTLTVSPLFMEKSFSHLVSKLAVP